MSEPLPGPDPTPAMLARAERRTGLSDWGGDDFREGLGVLVASMARDAALHAAGRMAVGTLVAQGLSNRLRYVEAQRVLL